MHNRLNQPDFQKKYREACTRLLKDHTAAMQIAMGEAVSVLREVMNNKDCAGGVRVSAAETVLRNGMKMTEQTNILERLEALESGETRE